VNPAENRKYESFANGILNLDSRIFTSLLVKNPGGAILAEAVRPEMRNTLGSISQRTDGMVGIWSILTFNSVVRLEKARSKTKYITIGRETTKGMIFPAHIFEDVMIGLTIEPKTEATEIYELVMRFVEENIRLVRA